MGMEAILVVVASLVVAIAIPLATRRRERPPSVPAGARAGEIFLERRSVKIGGIGYDEDYGTLVVPENRADPASRLLALPVRRLRSKGPEPTEPLFYLTGGPGQSNMGFRPASWLIAKRDIVMVGYRGVDGTSRLDCPEIREAMKGSGGDLLGEESLDGLARAMATAADRLRAEGVDLRGYTIPEVVEDMELARRALGYERIDLLGESYGTRVAQAYALMHPDRLRRSALIGVNPPGHFSWSAEMADAQVEYYAELYRRDAAHAARPLDLAAAMRRVNGSMPMRWKAMPIDPGKARVVAFALLFNRTTAPVVFDAYLAADRGDPSGLALMSLAYDFILPGMMVWGDFFAKGSADFEPGRDYRVEFSAPGAIVGAPMSLLTWGSMSGWPVEPLGPEFRTAKPTDVETLLVSGSVDFSCPPRFAEEELLPTLHWGRHVILSEQGHVDDFWIHQPAAAERLLTSFYDEGGADDSLYRYLPMDFKPSMSFPLLAKLLHYTGVLLILKLTRAVSRLARRSSAKGGKARRR